MSGVKTYRDHVMKLSKAILSACGSTAVTDLTEALTVILASIGENVMAGTDHVPDPSQSTMEKCSVNACFMAACTVPLITGLHELGCHVDADSLMHRTGGRVYQNYGESQRREIVDAGVLMFKDMIGAAGDKPKLLEWMGSVSNVVDRYVLTEGQTDCVELFSPLYLVLLMAAGQAGSVLRKEGKTGG